MAEQQVPRRGHRLPPLDRPLATSALKQQILHGDFVVQLNASVGDPFELVDGGGGACVEGVPAEFTEHTFLVIGNQLLFHGDAHPTNAEEARRRLQADEPRTVHLRSPKWAALLASLPADGDTTHTMEDMRRLAAPTLRSSSQAAALAQALYEVEIDDSRIGGALQVSTSLVAGADVLSMARTCNRAGQAGKATGRSRTGPSSLGHGYFTFDFSTAVMRRFKARRLVAAGEDAGTVLPLVPPGDASTVMNPVKVFWAVDGDPKHLFLPYTSGKDRSQYLLVLAPTAYHGRLWAAQLARVYNTAAPNAAVPISGPTSVSTPAAQPGSGTVPSDFTLESQLLRLGSAPKFIASATDGSPSRKPRLSRPVGQRRDLGLTGNNIWSGSSGSSATGSESSATSAGLAPLMRVASFGSDAPPGQRINSPTPKRIASFNLGSGRASPIQPIEEGRAPSPVPMTSAPSRNRLLAAVGRVTSSIGQSPPPMLRPSSSFKLHQRTGSSSSATDATADESADHSSSVSAAITDMDGVTSRRRIEGGSSRLRARKSSASRRRQGTGHKDDSDTHSQRSHRHKKHRTRRRKLAGRASNGSVSSTASITSRRKPGSVRTSSSFHWKPRRSPFVGALSPLPVRLTQHREVSGLVEGGTVSDSEEQLMQRWYGEIDVFLHGIPVRRRGKRGKIEFCMGLGLGLKPQGHSRVVLSSVRRPPNVDHTVTASTKLFGLWGAVVSSSATVPRSKRFNTWRLSSTSDDMATSVKTSGTNPRTGSWAVMSTVTGAPAPMLGWEPQRVRRRAHSLDSGIDGFLPGQLHEHMLHAGKARPVRPPRSFLHNHASFRMPKRRQYSRHTGRMASTDRTSLLPWGKLARGSLAMRALAGHSAQDGGTVSDSELCTPFWRQHYNPHRLGLHSRTNSSSCAPRKGGGAKATPDRPPAHRGLRNVISNDTGVVARVSPYAKKQLKQLREQRRDLLGGNTIIPLPPSLTESGDSAEGPAPAVWGANPSDGLVRGLRVGDVVTAVNYVSVERASVEEVAERLYAAPLRHGVWVRVARPLYHIPASLTQQQITTALKEAEARGGAGAILFDDPSGALLAALERHTAAGIAAGVIQTPAPSKRKLKRLAKKASSAESKSGDGVRTTTADGLEGVEVTLVQSESSDEEDDDTIDVQRAAETRLRAQQQSRGSAGHGEGVDVNADDRMFWYSDSDSDHHPSRQGWADGSPALSRQSQSQPSKSRLRKRKSRLRHHSTRSRSGSRPTSGGGSELNCLDMDGAPSRRANQTTPHAMSPKVGHMASAFGHDSADDDVLDEDGLPPDATELQRTESKEAGQGSTDRAAQVAYARSQSAMPGRAGPRDGSARSSGAGSPDIAASRRVRAHTPEPKVGPLQSALRSGSVYRRRPGAGGGQGSALSKAAQRQAHGRAVSAAPDMRRGGMPLSGVQIDTSTGEWSVEKTFTKDGRLVEVATPKVSGVHGRSASRFSRGVGDTGRAWTPMRGRDGASSAMSVGFGEVGDYDWDDDGRGSATSERYSPSHLTPAMLASLRAADLRQRTLSIGQDDGSVAGSDRGLNGIARRMKHKVNVSLPLTVSDLPDLPPELANRLNQDEKLRTHMLVDYQRYLAKQEARRQRLLDQFNDQWESHRVDLAVGEEGPIQTGKITASTLLSSNGSGSRQHVHGHGTSGGGGGAGYYTLETSARGMLVQHALYQKPFRITVEPIPHRPTGAYIRRIHRSSALASVAVPGDLLYELDGILLKRVPFPAVRELLEQVEASVSKENPCLLKLWRPPRTKRPEPKVEPSAGQPITADALQAIASTVPDSMIDGMESTFSNTMDVSESSTIRGRRLPKGGASVRSVSSNRSTDKRVRRFRKARSIGPAGTRLYTDEYNDGVHNIWTDSGSATSRSASASSKFDAPLHLSGSDSESDDPASQEKWKSEDKATMERFRRSKAALTRGGIVVKSDATPSVDRSLTKHHRGPHGRAVASGTNYSFALKDGRGGRSAAHSATTRILQSPSRRIRDGASFLQHLRTHTGEAGPDFGLAQQTQDSDEDKIDPSFTYDADHTPHAVPMTPFGAYMARGAARTSADDSDSDGGEDTGGPAAGASIETMQTTELDSLEENMALLDAPTEALLQATQLTDPDARLTPLATEFGLTRAAIHRGAAAPTLVIDMRESLPGSAKREAVAEGRAEVDEDGDFVLTYSPTELESLEQYEVGGKPTKPSRVLLVDEEGGDEAGAVTARGASPEEPEDTIKVVGTPYDVSRPLLPEQMAPDVLAELAALETAAPKPAKAPTASTRPSYTSRTPVRGAASGASRDSGRPGVEGTSSRPRLRPRQSSAVSQGRVPITPVHRPAEQSTSAQPEGSASRRRKGKGVARSPTSAKSGAGNDLRPHIDMARISQRNSAETAASGKHTSPSLRSRLRLVAERGAAARERAEVMTAGIDSSKTPVRPVPSATAVRPPGEVASLSSQASTGTRGDLRSKIVAAAASHYTKSRASSGSSGRTRRRQLDLDC